MDVSEHQRRRLTLVSAGLVLAALIGSLGAWQLVDGYRLDLPMIGAMVAALASAASVLTGHGRPRLRKTFEWVAILLTVPCAALVLMRIWG